MSTDEITVAAIADAGALLDVLTSLAETIDYSDSVATATDSAGAVTIADVAGLSLIADIADVADSLATLVATPSSLAAGLVALIQDFADTGIGFTAVADALAGVAWGSSIPAAGLNRATIIANRAALLSLMSLQALIEAARAAAAATYDSQDSALSVRDDLADRLDAAGVATSDRDLRAALDALRTTLVLDINQRAAALSALETYTPPAELPALVLAHELYDDPSQANDLCTRNAVEHPLFVPATALTVLAP
ncbi:MAG: hypothetical protein RLZZ501_1740 [Pseudomonadota bacterium]|jgi:prophage DNA circulation protein